MSNLTPQNIIDKANLNLADNVTKDIVAEDVRSLVIDLADSSLNRNTDTTKLGLKTHLESVNYLIGDTAVYSGIIYQAIANTTGPFDPVKWESLEGAVVLLDGSGTTFNGDKVDLGGPLTGYTLIDAAGNDLTINNIETFLVRCNLDGAPNNTEIISNFTFFKMIAYGDFPYQSVSITGNSASGTLSINNSLSLLGANYGSVGDYQNLDFDNFAHRTHIPPIEMVKDYVSDTQPTGWAHYTDSLTTPTLALTTTFSKLTVDGTGGTSESNYLPKEIRGVSELWDVATNKITPISVGDSYNLRLDLEITAKTGAVANLFIELDIGGGATPTIVIVDRILGIGKSAPFTLSISFPIFCLSTFVTNGGQIFLATDSGTATIGKRSIFIQRVSSGTL